MIPYTAKEGSVRSGYIEECVFFFKKRQRQRIGKKTYGVEIKEVSRRKEEEKEYKGKKKPQTDILFFFSVLQEN